ncbi:MAG: GFA family protein [Deltaproteobacteria bacterium]
MSATFTGGCICRAVRYECSAEPIMMANCHCRDCQRAGGSAFAPAVIVPTASLKITGEAKFHDTQSDSGNIVSRGFCPNCGARLFGKTATMPDLMAIMAGSLDDPSWYQPRMDIYTGSAQPWDAMNPQLPKFQKSPRG